MYKVGDVVIRADLDKPDSLVEMTVTKVGKDTVQCGGPESVFYVAFLWPQRAKEELLKVIKERARLKKLYDDSMGLVYELKNKLARNEL